MEDFKEKKIFYETKIKKAIENFKKEGFNALYFETSDKATDYFFSQIKKDDIIGYGGSKTLTQLSIIENLRNNGYKLLDRTKPDITSEEKAEIERKNFFADVFIASSNAVSEMGALVNIDMYNNRVAAMLFGPKKVYLFIGRNKLCSNLEEAIHRSENIASVMNGIRFNIDPKKIQASMTIIKKNVIENRMNLLFINEDLGF